MVDHIPDEIVLNIVLRLRRSELHSALQLNSSWYRVCKPFLYAVVDLRIHEDQTYPRIDCFCRTIVEYPNMSTMVKELRLGPVPGTESEHIHGQLPADPSVDNVKLALQVKALIPRGSLVPGTIHNVHATIRNIVTAIQLRRYSGYSAFLFTILRHVRDLTLMDINHYSSQRYVPSALIFIGHVTGRIMRHQEILYRRTNYRKISYNFDKDKGLRYSEDEERHFRVHSILCLVGIEELQFSIAGRFTEARNCLVKYARPSTLTVLVIRHSPFNHTYLEYLFSFLPHLKSLTYDVVWEKSTAPGISAPPIDFNLWNSSLSWLKDRLEKLCIAVEYYDLAQPSFRQPLLEQENFVGRLDLTNFPRLTAVELPIAFVTGNVEFDASIGQLFLPPRLEHLCLRLDMSRAQMSFQPNFATILDDAYEEQTNYMAAQVSMVSLPQTIIDLLARIPKLSSFTVWQPNDPSLCWDSREIDVLAETCSQRSLKASLLVPTLMRSMDPVARNIVKERFFFRPDVEEDLKFDYETIMHHENRNGLPIGLASQYHMRALMANVVLPFNLWAWTDMDLIHWSFNDD